MYAYVTLKVSGEVECRMNGGHTISDSTEHGTNNRGPRTPRVQRQGTEQTHSRRREKKVANDKEGVSIYTSQTYKWPVCMVEEGFTEPLPRTYEPVGPGVGELLPMNVLN